MPSERQQVLSTVITRLQLRYGERAISQAFSPTSDTPRFPHISTTFPELDAALGIGGLPRGRISEIVGPPTSGKVTLAAKLLSAAHQERESLAAWLDLGRSCDPDYLHRCGVDLERLLIVRPRTLADALGILLHLAESNTLAALVFDSLADLEPSHEPQLAGTLERLVTVAAHSETVVVFLNEPGSQFRTLAHLATVRLETHRAGWILQGQDIRGYDVQVKIVKHKLGQAGGSVPIHITFDSTLQGDQL